MNKPAGHILQVFLFLGINRILLQNSFAHSWIKTRISTKQRWIPCKSIYDQTPHFIQHLIMKHYLYSTYAKILSSLILGCLFVTTSIPAQSIPAPSPKSVIQQKIGLANFTVEYSRPSVKDRNIFGDLVPYDAFWRTGANQPTKVTFDEEIQINGERIPAGSYALYSIPGKQKWTVIFSNKHELPGRDGYDASNDQLRFEVTPTSLSEQVETFTIGFDHLRDDGAIMNLDWDHTRVAFSIHLDTRQHVLASIEEVMNSGEELNAGNYARAATAYLNYEVDLDKAAMWMAKANEMQPHAFWNIYTEAEILAKLGKIEQAIATAQKSIEIAKANDGGDFGYIKRNEEFIASLK